MVVSSETPSIKPDVQTANVGGFSKVLADSAATQSIFTSVQEAPQSRQIQADLQRASVVFICYIRGRPDIAELDSSLDGFKPGDPSPQQTRFPDAFITHVKYEHQSHGREADDAEAKDEAQAWTKCTLIYQQRPCPSMYELERATTLTAYQEWYTREQPILPFTNTVQPIPVLRPNTILVRRYVKVRLSQYQLGNLDKNEGTVNSTNFERGSSGTWLFEGARLKLLYGDPNDVAFYEAILTWRADRLRRHRWFWPKLDQHGVPRLPGFGNTYEEMHDTRDMYGFEATPFDLMIPTTPSACQPNQS